MAGWTNFTGAGNGGRGAGGRGFPNHRNSSDGIHHGGGGGTGGSGRWRERSRGRPPQQPNFRYRPVDATHRDTPPPPLHHYASSGPAPSASSTSARHAQMTHPPTTDKSSTSISGTPASASTREPDDKASRNAANFECNVCFDMAADPVVTKCGHLFCWECLYQWLHVHSHHRECPVCKGQVADDAVIPIYGRGGSAASVENAPPRPTGARVESSRQQQHQLPTFPHPLVYLDEEEEEDPFDFQGMNIGFGANTLRDAAMRFMSATFDDVEMEDQYDDYTNEYDPDDFDEVYDYHLLGFPVVPSTGAGAVAGNPSSSQPHTDFFNFDSIAGTVSGPYQNHGFTYSGSNSHNRGRHGRRNRSRARSSASADYSSTDAVVMGSSLTIYHDTSASHNVSGGHSTRPNGGWAERRGRSNRNSNSASGRGMQDSRRHRTNYN
ncbi:hypothetical protein ACP70R_020790 [Stipagrostis hirtigluma subsp. patula]